MYRKLSEVWEILNQTIYTGKRERDNLFALAVVSVFTAALGLVMMLADIAAHDTNMLISALVTTACGLACAYFVWIRKDREKAALIPTFFCIFAFTIYTFRGMGEGTGALWALMAPIGLCYFVSVRNGILVSIYYTVFFFVLFYTPLKENMWVYYTDAFMMRFPLLYACMSAFTAISMIQYHRGVLLENEYAEVLNKAIAEQTEIAESRARKIEEISYQTIQTLTSAIDAKDPYTRGHSYRVSQYSVLIAEQLNWPPERIYDLRFAAMLHDVGKIGVPDSILNKPNRLTEMEYRIIQSHTTMGGDILKERIMIKAAEDVARCHHERYDGKGYPLGLKGGEISEEARIVAVADSFDAMSSNRIYLNGHDFNHIRNELLEGRGRQFDPHFTDVFIDLWDRGMLDEILQSVEEKDDTEIGVHSEQLKDIMDTFLTQNTGLMDEAAIAHSLRERGGAFVVFELENITVSADGSGQDTMNRVPRMLRDILVKNTDGLCCRMGVSQFMLLFPGVPAETAENRIRAVLSAFESAADLPDIRLYAGIVMCSPGELIGQALYKADKALYHVRQQGGNGYSFYVSNAEPVMAGQVDLNKLVHGITDHEGVMDVEYQQFVRLYEYVKGISRRFAHPIRLVMITLTAGEKPLPNELERAMYYMEQSIRQNIRKVDVLTRYNQQNFLMILIGVQPDGVRIVVERIFRGYYKMAGSSAFQPSYSVADTDDDPAQS